MSRRKATEDFRDRRSGERQPAVRRSGAVRAVLFLPSRREPRPSNRLSGCRRGAPRATRDDEGTEVFLSLVDLSSRPVRPNVEALTVRTICTNRDLPSRLPFGNEAGDFELEGAVPVKRIVALIKPTDALRPPVGKDSHVAAGFAALAELSFAGGRRQGSDAGDPAAVQLHRLARIPRSRFEGLDRAATAGGISRA